MAVIPAPAEVFEGANGVKNAVGAFEWPTFPERGGHFRVTGTQIKVHPCIYPGQSPVEATLAVRGQVSDPTQVESIVVRTYWNAWWESASEPEMWAPSTRETADHSIPYLVAAALLDGWITVESFTPERMTDPRLKSLIKKVQVIHDTELDKLQPALDPCRLEVIMKDGTKKFSSIDFPKGHVKNPPSDTEIEEKLVRLNNGLLSSGKLDRLLDLCWRLDELEDVGELVSATRIEE